MVENRGKRPQRGRRTALDGTACEREAQERQLVPCGGSRDRVLKGSAGPA
eukprot:CAMPEP_0174915124 /NCGR_PEP_ID=MMETSP1355-20121228/285_1 /TAXON_ID=464990 /ORGANISM="Hemiselmis tepida, Strain CCMP443" /LENGTH=49 /DNA_ID=CAMNT_0016159943 /DNA_START=228 /DNA_END=377 /DNA_ORIENTATION=-